MTRTDQSDQTDQTDQTDQPYDEADQQEIISIPIIHPSLEVISITPDTLVGSPPQFLKLRINKKSDSSNSTSSSTSEPVQEGDTFSENSTFSFDEKGSEDTTPSSSHYPYSVFNDQIERPCSTQYDSYNENPDSESPGPSTSSATGSFQTPGVSPGPFGSTDVLLDSPGLSVTRPSSISINVASSIFSRWSTPEQSASCLGSCLPMWSSITGGHESRQMSAKTVTPTTPNEGIRHTRPLMAYVIIKTLGSDWEGSQKLVELSEQAPPFADKLFHKLSRIHKDTQAECRRVASLFPIEPTTYKHQLTELYTAFVREAEKVGHSENPGMLTTFIAFTVELCRWCIEKKHSIDVLSIHEYTCRLISESDTPCTPNEWEQYIDDIPSSSRLARKTSMWDVILMSLRAYDEYSRYTS